jgi:hypothetical protein
MACPYGDFFTTSLAWGEAGKKEIAPYNVNRGLAAAAR